MALRSQVSPKTNSNPPTATRKTEIDKCEIAGPKIAMMATRVTNPVMTPRSADFQSRAVPTARTMVTASTASTAQAKKTEINKASDAPNTSTSF